MFGSHCMHITGILCSAPQNGDQSCLFSRKKPPKQNTKTIHYMENAPTLTQQGTPKGTFGDLHTGFHNALYPLHP